MDHLRAKKVLQQEATQKVIVFYLACLAPLYLCRCIIKLQV